MQISIEQIQALLNEGLPGPEAQWLMAPPVRSKSLEVPDYAKSSAVGIVLYESGGLWKFPLIQRTLHDLDPHSGQISLPGGKQNIGESLLETALREIEEEIGISATDLKILGALTPLYIPVSGFHVHPFLMHWFPNNINDSHEQNFWNVQIDEVVHIIETPISWLKNPHFRTTRTVSNRKGILHDVPCFQFQDAIVWGATAMMLSELSELLHKLPS